MYGRNKQCSKGHPKDGNHICAWADVSKNFKECQPSQRLPGVPQTAKTAGEKKMEQELAKVKAENEELKKQTTMNVDADGAARCGRCECSRIRP